MVSTGVNIPFAPPQTGDEEAESYWIRLVPVEQKDEGAELAEAAALIDELYSLSPCDNGDLGTGGEADDAELPEQEEFLARAVDMLDLRICKRSSGGEWEAEVDVLRSHQDIGYTLESETAEFGETTVVTASVTETLEGVGRTHDLEWPYGGDIAASGAEVEEVRGSTVFFVAPVEGRVRLSYSTVYDRVKLTVRPGAKKSGNWAAQIAQSGRIAATAGGAGAGQTADRESASVVAFWGDIAAECTVSPPPEDDSIDAAEIERICNTRSSAHLRGECWQTKEYYNICNCSGREAPDPPEPEDIEVSCPEGTAPGAFLGVVRELKEYVDCANEDDGLADPDFFRAHCCNGDYRDDLPHCETTREPHKGGEEIENGPEYYKNIYGENVVLTAVSPEGGCGEIVRRWNVPPELEAPPKLPESMVVDRGQTFTVTVLSGGRAPFGWHIPVGVTQLGTAAYGYMGIFRAHDDFSGGVMTVTDSCDRRSNRLVLSPPAHCKWVYDSSVWPVATVTGGRPSIADMLQDKPYDYDIDLLCDIWQNDFSAIAIHSNDNVLPIYRLCKDRTSEYGSYAVSFSKSRRYGIVWMPGLYSVKFRGRMDGEIINFAPPCTPLSGQYYSSWDEYISRATSVEEEEVSSVLAGASLERHKWFKYRWSPRVWEESWEGQCRMGLIVLSVLEKRCEDDDA